ncbi:hypothetical protein BKA56DRAFT_60510 [Ilyonectria sp. MPI-CAGE-AT-0026]|nr:hypothetical protein BKA56DRAFT_60510 [Ilyonectria sp. MPI-CAGE-AT-0026]
MLLLDSLDVLLLLACCTKYRTRRPGLEARETPETLSRLRTSPKKPPSLPPVQLRQPGPPEARAPETGRPKRSPDEPDEGNQTTGRRRGCGSEAAANEVVSANRGSATLALSLGAPRAASAPSGIHQPPIKANISNHLSVLGFWG